MGLRKGDLVKSKINGIEGIVLNFLTSEYNSYFHKVEIFCTYSPYNSRFVGQTIVINDENLEIKNQK